MEVSPYFVGLETVLENISSVVIIPFSIAISIIYYAAHILFAITCHRVVLIGDTGVPEYGMFSWTRREWWFLAYLILLPFVYLLTSALILMAHGLLMEFDIEIKSFQIISWKLDGFLLLAFILALPSVYIFSRLSLLYPATAVDRDVDVDWAWKITKNNGWRLIVIIVLLPLAFAFSRILFLREGATWIEDVIGLLLGLILLAVEIVALSLSYKHLTENEIIETEGA